MPDRLIAIRVDNSSFIGLGHSQRCLYIALELRKINFEVIFISRQLKSSNYSIITNYGFKVYELSSNNLNKIDEKDHSKWLCVDSDSDSQQTYEILSSLGCKTILVDHYGIGSNWEEKLKEKNINIAVIDDLDREHYCNLLIDYSFWKKESDFNKFQNIDNFIIGKGFFPLDERLRDHKIKEKNFLSPNILISVGGHDREGLTEEILLGLNKIKDLPYNKIYIVVNEQSSISISSLLLETDLDYEMHISPDGLGEIYSKIDLCIGSSGISALERCYFGIPSLLIIKAKNQEDLGKNLHDHKLATSIKLKTDLDLVKELEVFLKNYETNKQISNNCHNFISSNGSREIAAEIKKLLLI